MTSSSPSPDDESNWAGFAHSDEETDPEHEMPPGPFAITSMPAVRPMRPYRPPSKLSRTVAEPTPGDD